MGETAIYIVDFYQYLYDQLESLNYIPKSGAFVFAHTPEASRTNAAYRKLILFAWGVAASVGWLAGMILACDAECWGGCWQPVD